MRKGRICDMSSNLIRSAAVVAHVEHAVLSVVRWAGWAQIFGIGESLANLIGITNGATIGFLRQGHGGFELLCLMA